MVHHTPASSGCAEATDRPQRPLAIRLAVSPALAGPRQRGVPDPSIRSALAEAVDELQLGLAELRELARGIHPAILTQRGLAGAVESLAVRMAIPVETSVDAGACPPAIQAAAYFVICEALTNVVKHARASEAAVRAGRVGGSLGVEVRDDGVGNADPSRGSGLRGLADRVAAYGGRLTVASPPGGGTRV